MRSLHIRLLVANPDRDDVATLRSALQAAGHVVLSDDPRELPAGVSAGPDFVVSEGTAQPTPESLDGAEARHLAATLRFTGGNKRQASLLLGIARSTLLAKVRKYGLQATR